MYNAKLGNADWLRERVNKMNRRTRKAALSDGYHDNITPLHRAAQNGFVDACRALVDGGCDVNKQDVDYKTPLYYSVEANQDEVVKYLTQQVKARTTRSMTRKLDDGTVITVELESPLHKACEKGFLECVKELVKGGADSNLIIDDGYLLFGDTPLHRAASAGHSDVVRFLIEQGANIDKGDNDGNTALHRAAYRGYEPVCQLLVREGANLDAINGRNETPRDMSRKGNAIAVDQYFSGCNPNVLSECAKRRRDREKALGIGQFASDAPAAMPWQRKASALAAAAADVPETADASADAAAADETAPPPDADASPDDDEDAAVMHQLRRRLSSIRVGLFGSSLSLSSKGGNESPDSGRRQSSPMALLTRMGSRCVPRHGMPDNAHRRCLSTLRRVAHLVAHPLTPPFSASSACAWAPGPAPRLPRWWPWR